MPRALSLPSCLAAPLLCALACLLVAPVASPAAPAEYGPEGLRFMLDIPEGWQIERRMGGVDFYPPGGRAFASVLAHTQGGKRPDAVAKSLCASMQARSCEKTRGGAWLIVSERKGTRLFTTLQFVRNMLLLTSYAGDSRTVQPVLKTLKVKR
ncbi:MAG: hypothetical protein K6C33_01920 [Desulfovibrio sp.]|nr:hypothetical protein [Desulfovibrio sp.]